MNGMNGNAFSADDRARHEEPIVQYADLNVFSPIGLRSIYYVTEM